MATNEGSRPVPDPTVLTTQALEREVAAVKESTAKDLAGLAKLVEEKFSLMEKYRVEQKQDATNALRDTLAAAKESASKTETNFTKQIEATDGKVNDVKERVSNLEGRNSMLLSGVAVLISAMALMYSLLRSPSPPQAVVGVQQPPPPVTVQPVK